MSRQREGFHPADEKLAFGAAIQRQSPPPDCAPAKPQANIIMDLHYGAGEFAAVDRRELVGESKSFGIA